MNKETETLTNQPLTNVRTGGKNVDVSVITVVFNAVKNGRRETMLQCMASVQEQQGLTVEHIIIDGGSDDGTVELVEDFQTKKTPIIFRSKPDNGIYDAMNRGLEMAQGKYVTFLNSDDYYHQPDGLLTSFRSLEQSTCDYSFAPVITLGDERSGNPHCHPWWYIKDAFFHAVFSHQSVLCRRSVITNCGGFDTTYKSAADYEMMLRLMLSGHRGLYVDYSFVTYRMTGLSSVNIELSQQETAKVCMKLYNKYLHTKLTEQEARLIHTSNKFPLRYFWLKRKLRRQTQSVFCGLPKVKNIGKDKRKTMAYALTTILHGRWNHLCQLMIVCFNSRFSWKWYLKEYANDLNNTMLPAPAHYLDKGWHEGKDPSPRFSTKRYLSNYPDVRQADICPLVHWKMTGKKERRIC